MIINLIRCSDLLESTLIHNCDTIRHIDGLFLIMRDIDKSNTKFFL